MNANVGSIDRLLRLIVGAVLFAAPFVTTLAMFSSVYVVSASVIVGLVLIVTAAIGFCPLYRLIGVSTCKI